MAVLIDWSHQSIGWLYALCIGYYALKPKLRFKRRKANTELVDRALSLTDMSVNKLIVSNSNASKTLARPLQIANDRFHLKMLFMCPDQFENIYPNLTENGKELYNLGKTSSNIVKQAILGLLAIQAKIASLDECIGDILYCNNAVTKVPKTVLELFTSLFIVHKFCDDFNINHNVYGEVSPDDFIYDLMKDLDI